MRLRFLGTGTSFGVPVIGCDCAVCTSDDPRNQRTRHGFTLEANDSVLLVDTPPELRIQLLREKIARVDAVFITHLHADHVHGIDDLRIFSMRGRGPLPMYIASEYVEELSGRFQYIFDKAIKPLPGTSAPEIDLRTFEPGDELSIGDFRLTTLPFPHGNVSSYGFRVGKLGVIVDGAELPKEALSVLAGVEVLIINALWKGKRHPTHFNVEEAVEAVAQIGAKRAYLTHLTHRLEYNELLADLPDGVEPAYDGLVVEVEQA